MQNIHSTERENVFNIAQSQNYAVDNPSTIIPNNALDRECLSIRKKLVKKYLGFGAKILEIGPGGGDFLRWAADEGYQLSVIEESAMIAEKLMGVTNANVFVGRFEENSFENDTQDAICSFHVIEHVVEPKKHLEEALRLVRPGGLAFIATPNSQSWSQRVLTSLSPHFDSAHIRIFSHTSLRKLAVDSGWEIVDLQTPEYTSAFLRLLSKALRRIRREDEEETAGKYSKVESNLARKILIFLIFVSSPIRHLISKLRFGNEIFLVVRRPVVVSLH